MNDIEKTGPSFILDKYLAARKLCLKIAEEIILKVEIGMNEQDGQDLVKAVCSDYGISHYWHPTKFRIGADTMKSFRMPPEPTIKVSSGEICFIDIGPVIDGHEADFGKTFIIGTGENNPKYERLVSDSEEIFKQTALAWQNDRLTGKALFAFAEALSARDGYVLNPLMAGHRLGEFPHRIQQKLFEFDQHPQKNLWVLEILISDPRTQRGAFYEDILLD